jgi:anti-sigma B factor antagonist
MHVDVRNADDVIIVDLEGRLVAGTGDEILREVINTLVADDWKKILLNLHGVDRIDSSGIGELNASRELAERFGSDVRLVNVRGRVLEILDLSQILPLFHIYEDEATALQGFADSDLEN